MLIAIATLRPVVRGGPSSCLLPAFVSHDAGLLGVRGLLPDGPPVGLLMLSPPKWEVLVLVPRLIGVIAASSACGSTNACSASAGQAPGSRT